MTDRRDQVSAALTEIRTVRSRAESARAALAENDGKSETRWEPAGMDDYGYVPPSQTSFRDPDADEIDRLLAEFIEKTAKFAGRGSRRPGTVSKQRGQ